ncbi:alpha/beta hydrolase [uncultured Metabacillus sp.]|uniref:alpha/beta hydrolase n=1 Tax=uncultured Metabacillus sp. TaxID=2860135 RepID=UPI00262A19D0|nr:alpha/beta hydrolase [uncultured Metabacillus sp.]
MNSIVEELVSFKSDVTLKGTIACPNTDDDQYPAIIMINGSGGADRDGNMKKPALVTNLYKELAHFLTDLGFVTLRYDKRAVGESEGNSITSGMLDLVNDIISAIIFLKNHPKVNNDQIILLGHSEGCVLATKVNETLPVAGLILLAGAGTNLKEPIIYQNRQTIEEIKNLKGIKGTLLRLLVKEHKIAKQTEELFSKMESSTGDTIRIKMKKMPAKWFREHLRYRSEDVLNALKQANCPILAITGDKDVQANYEDLKRIDVMEKSNAKTVVIKNMDHMLKEFKGEKTVLNLLKQYKKEATAPIHNLLKDELRDWLTKHYLEK